MLNEKKIKKAVLKSRSNEIETQEKKAKSNIQGDSRVWIWTR
jgi:hypothetical protein